MSQQLMEEQVTSEFAHLNILKELNNAKGILEETIEKERISKISLLKNQEMSSNSTARTFAIR